MSDINKLKQGAEILQQVDVTDIITSLAVGIADAQEKLDNNSIKQAIALADPANGIGGRSLISMGFAPAFYHFQHADVSAEIELKMRLQTEFELDASLTFNYNQQGGYSTEKLDYLREDSNSKHKNEHKSSRSFITHADNYEELTVESTEVKMDSTKGSVSRVEDYQDQLRSEEKIDRVSTQYNAQNYIATAITATGVVVKNTGGYVVITLPSETKAEGILKVSDYALTTSVEFTGDATDEYEIGTGGSKKGDFQAVLTESLADLNTSSPAQPGTIIGYNSTDSTFHTAPAGTGKVMELYFDFDKDNAVIALGTVLSDPQNPGNTKDNTEMQEPFDKLALSLVNDPTGRITITGHTDGSGKVAYNKDLSNRRANSLKDWFISRGVKPGQITTVGDGETIAGTDQGRNLDFRKCIIKLGENVDYFYMSNGNFDNNGVEPNTPAAKNSFIYAQPVTGTSPFTIEFKSGGADVLTVANGTPIASLLALTNISEVKEHFSTEIIRNSAYLLHNKTDLKYTTYSDKQESTSYATGSKESEDFNDSNSDYLIDENTNSSSRIKKDHEKRENPSTIAVGASVDLRIARQFEMSVSGNSKVSARLISLPAPPEFLEEIKKYYS